MDHYRDQKANQVRGSPTYCSALWPCRRYDGHCKLKRFGGRMDNTCAGSDFCAEGVGSKYGMPKSSAACIPAYNLNQIAFTPGELTKSMPATFIFTARGDVEMPEKHATVRIVKGDNVREPASL